VPLSLYSGFGTVWNRLLVRPLVPDIARIPEEERAYYEKVMVSPIHNPNKVDLGKDVLFELISKKYAGLAYRRIDARVWKPLERAVDRFKTQRAKALKRGDQKAAAVFADQYYRATALRCLFETLRNSAVWIYAVHEYQDSPQKTARSTIPGNSSSSGKRRRLSGCISLCSGRRPSFTARIFPNS
jgi:hypothetical protein